MNTISIKELEKRLKGGKEVHLLDVREPHEHEEFNIGGTLIPVDQVSAGEVEEIEDQKDEEWIVYCRSGHRSGIACEALEKQGFKNVKNLEGGMLAWQENQKKEE